MYNSILNLRSLFDVGRRRRSNQFCYKRKWESNKRVEKLRTALCVVINEFLRNVLQLQIFKYMRNLEIINFAADKIIVCEASEKVAPVCDDQSFDLGSVCLPKIILAKSKMFNADCNHIKARRKRRNKPSRSSLSVAETWRVLECWIKERISIDSI